MKRLSTAMISLSIAALLTSPALADEKLEKAIKSRQALMSLYSWNLGQLGAMAKGVAAYDADVAKTAAARLDALVKMSDGALWPAGSDSTAMPGKTRAKAEAWTTWPAISEKQTDMITASEALAAAAGGGLESLQGAIGAAGKACGGCHKPYRDEKE